jgi:hypothetical protein
MINSSDTSQQRVPERQLRFHLNHFLTFQKRLIGEHPTLFTQSKIREAVAHVGLLLLVLKLSLIMPRKMELCLPYLNKKWSIVTLIVTDAMVDGKKLL